MVLTLSLKSGFNFKPKTSTDDYSFNFFKKFKIIVINNDYGDVAIKDLFDHLERCYSQISLVLWQNLITLFYPCKYSK